MCCDGVVQARRKRRSEDTISRLQREAKLCALDAAAPARRATLMRSQLSDRLSEEMERLAYEEDRRARRRLGF